VRLLMLKVQYYLHQTLSNQDIYLFRAFADILRVLVGSHHRTEIDEDQDSIPVNSLILHENYDSYTVENDICLLELGEKVTMGEHVGLIALPDPMEEYEAGTMCTVTGWGALSEGGSLGDTLQKVDVPVVSDEECRAAYGQADVADSMICAGFDQGGKDSCQVIPKKLQKPKEITCACRIEL